MLTVGRASAPVRVATSRFSLGMGVALAMHDWRTIRRVHWTMIAGGLALLLFEPVVRFGISLLRGM